jgi:hypothetical protein
MIVDPGCLPDAYSAWGRTMYNMNAELGQPGFYGITLQAAVNIKL